MIYLDTSAMAKLAIPERETAALRSWLAGDAFRIRASSELIRVELLRATARWRGDAITDARQLLARILAIPVSKELLDEAAALGPPSLRSLDAIHLASAMMIADRITAFVAYDKRLLEAAEAVGLPTAAPA